MSTTLPSIDPARPRADLLPGIADIFDEILRDSTGSLAIGIAYDDTGIDLHTLPLPGHPAPNLFGYVAPADWWAFGVASTGHTRALPRSLGGVEPWEAEGPPDPKVDQPMRLIHLISRDLDVYSVVSIDGHERDVSVDHGPEGLIPDICRRVLQLPTAPPPSTLALTARQWLESVVELLASSPIDLRWAEVALLHPTIERVADNDPHFLGYAIERLDRCGQMLAEVATWPVLRRQWSATPEGAFGLSPAEIEWMDDGMFARWCLAEFVELVDLLEAIEALATPEVHARTLAVLEQWELLPPREP